MAWEIVVKQERRLCTVNGKTGYFHTWEHYTNSSGQSGVYGLVEFEDSVRRVESTCIKFCDEENEMLRAFNEHDHTDEIKKRLVEAELKEKELCPTCKFDNIWSELRDRTEKIKQSNPPEFLTKCMNIRVPDCNDCGYLNYTEKQQQAYGANSYMKDHRCECYDRPVYHRANSRTHDSYIYPCEECKKANFVNYYMCESSKCNKKGE